MKSIIIAYPIKQTAMQIRSVLENEGLYVSHICATGASVLQIASDMRSGVIVCSSILKDISVSVLAEHLPAGFDIVSITKGSMESYMSNVINIPMPLDREDFVAIVRTLVSSDSSFTKRNKNEDEYISQAKSIIMNTKEMTEMQAHKYLQQLSMRESKKIAEVAQEILEQFG